MYYVEITASEFDRNASKILDAAERGERITVTRNGRPVAVLSPVTDDTVLLHPVDPMGEDTYAPVLHSGSAVDGSTGRGFRFTGFGA